jgi:hypothetical protein
MAEHRIRFKATGNIFNPWYELPVVHATVSGPGLANASIERLEITPPCRVELANYNLRLFFQNDEIVFIFMDDSSHLIYPILYFLTYRTFINYNIVLPATNQLDESAFNKVDNISFKVLRIIRVETERQEGDKIIKGYNYTEEDEWLVVGVDSLTQYLHVLNPALYYALTFFLIGCDNLRYFLVEFYKAVEAIKNVFSGENEFLKSLKPYGVTRNKFKEFGKVCNDMRLAPLDIGRHAPMPDAPLYALDLRNLLVEPRSREVFESSTVFCRQVIEAYMAFLIQQAT